MGNIMGGYLSTPTSKDEQATEQVRKTTSAKWAQIDGCYTPEQVAEMSQSERCNAGLPYLANEPALVRGRLRARRIYHQFNHSLPNLVDPPDLTPGVQPSGIGGSKGGEAAEAGLDVIGAERRALLAKLFGTSCEAMQKVEIEPPLWCDFGTNIKLEGSFYANWNTTFVDTTTITIGDGTLFGPNVHVYAGTHSIAATERAQGFERAAPVKIGRDCWLAGNVTVMPGVEIGDDCTIGAGSVVTADIPSGSVAVGVPARVVKRLAPHERASKLREQRTKHTDAS